MKTSLKTVLPLAALTISLACASERSTMPSNPSRSMDFLGLRATVLLSGADTGNASALLDVSIPASVGPAPHIHTRDDEVYLIKSGVFRFYMDGICLEAGPGATFYLAKRHMHAFKNIRQTPGELLLFVYPAGLDRYCREPHEVI
jgi:mannose-6-phosphate isomerase-like protein (cupin superfamily)